VGSNVLDGRPTPVSPLWTLQGLRLDIRCTCGRRVEMPVDLLLKMRDCTYDTKVHHIAQRLVCQPPAGCGARPGVHGVVGWKRRPPLWGT
jgi:hypothetical protein